MNEQTVAASSPAEVDVFQGRDSISVEEYIRSRQNPEEFKPATADSATADAPEKTVAPTEGDEPETAPDSEPETTQEPPKKESGAEKRIKQLLARVKELESKSEQAAKQDVKPVSSPVQAPETRSKPTHGDTNPDGTPKYAAYEDFVEDLADWKAEQRIEAIEQKRAAQAQAKELADRISQARQRHEDFDGTVKPFVELFVGDQSIPTPLKARVNNSAVFADLVFELAGDPDFLALAKSDPEAARDHIAITEARIKADLAGNEPTRNDKGQFVAAKTEKEAPAKPKTQAPRPPSPVGGGSARGAFDVSDDSLSADEWFRKRTEQLARKRT